VQSVAEKRQTLNTLHEYKGKGTGKTVMGLPAAHTLKIGGKQ